jgi:hypothetical protein
MTALTVILAPPGAASAGVRDVLADLSGAGLLDEVVWASGPDEACVLREGVRQRVSLAHRVSEPGHDRVRLAVLVPLGPSGDPPALSRAAEREVLELLEHGTGRIPITRVRIVLNRGEPAQRETLARGGWHNLLVAPEDAHGPGGGHAVLCPTRDPVDIGRHAAPVVAGVLGLWSGLPDCPLDVERPPADPRLRPVRVFYRRVDATPVEDVLRSLVLSTSPDLPLPRIPAAQVTYVDAPGRACAEMAKRLWDRHAGRIRRARQDVPPGPARPGIVRCLQWQPGFVWATLRGRLDGWYVARLDEVTSPQALALQARATQPRSRAAYAVLAGGLSPSGMPASWAELGAAAADLQAALTDPAMPPRAAPPPLSPLWHDYTAGALTLLDAGDRGGSHMPPIQQGNGLAVLRDVRDCVPDSSGDFHVTDGGVAASVQIGSVPAGDVLGADLLRARLEHLEGIDPALGLGTTQTRNVLAQWAGRHDATYAAQAARPLADRVRLLTTELRGQLGTLAAATAPPDGSVDRHRRQAKVGRYATTLTGIAVVAVLLTLLLLAVGSLGVGAALLTVAGTALAWLLLVPLGFRFGQRALLGDLARRSVLLHGAAQAERNILDTVEELRHCTDAYHQLLLWSRAVGVVLSHPLGHPAATSERRDPVIRGLPRSTRVGWAAPDDGVLRTVATRLRRETFGVGWLSEPWRHNLGDAVRHEVADSVGGLIDDTSPEAQLGHRIGSDLPLRRWVERLVAVGPVPRSGNDVWDRVLGTLGDPGHRIEHTDLVGSVRTGGGGGDEPIGVFLAGITDPDRQGRGFEPSMFTATARVADAGRVVHNHLRTAAAGLSQVSLLVQFGDPRPPWDFVAGDPEPDPPTPVADPDRAADPTDPLDDRQF